MLSFDKREQIEVGGQAVLACYHACDVIQALVFCMADFEAVIDASVSAHLLFDSAHLVGSTETVGTLESFGVGWHYAGRVRLTQSWCYLSVSVEKNWHHNSVYLVHNPVYLDSKEFG